MAEIIARGEVAKTSTARRIPMSTGNARRGEDDGHSHGSSPEQGRSEPEIPSTENATEARKRKRASLAQRNRKKRNTLAASNQARSGRSDEPEVVAEPPSGDREAPETRAETESGPGFPRVVLPRLRNDLGPARDFILVRSAPESGAPATAGASAVGESQSESRPVRRNPPRATARGDGSEEPDDNALDGGYRMISTETLSEILSSRPCSACRSTVPAEQWTEKRSGLNSCFYAECPAPGRCRGRMELNLCPRNARNVSSARPGRTPHEVNVQFVLGLLSTGTFYSGAERILTALGVPAWMHKDSFNDTMDRIEEVVTRLAKESCKLACEDLRRKLEADPRIPCSQRGWRDHRIIADMAYAKRSHRGRGGNSKLGLASLMDADAPNAILDFEVMQRYCMYCELARKGPPRDLTASCESERCPRNFEGKAKAMEAEAIKRMVKRLPYENKIRVNPLIQDGDLGIGTAIRDLEDAAITDGFRIHACFSHALKHCVDYCKDAKKRRQDLYKEPSPPKWVELVKGFTAAKTAKTNLCAMLHEFGYHLPQRGEPGYIPRRWGSTGGYRAGLEPTIAELRKMVAVLQARKEEERGELGQGYRPSSTRAAASPVSGRAGAAASPEQRSSEQAALPRPPVDLLDEQEATSMRTVWGKIAKTEHAQRLAMLLSYAFAENRSNKEAIRKTIKAIVPHMFDDHESCPDGDETWCMAKKDPDKAARSKKWYVRTNLIHEEGLRIWREIMDEVVDTWYLADDRLEQLYHADSSSMLESFHNLLAALAPKRLFLGRGTVYRLQVAIAVLKWNYGPAWLPLALEELGVEKPGATVLRRTSSQISYELRRHEERKSAEYKKKVLMRKRIRTEAGWEVRDDVEPVLYGEGPARVRPTEDVDGVEVDSDADDSDVASDDDTDDDDIQGDTEDESDDES